MRCEKRKNETPREPRAARTAHCGVRESCETVKIFERPALPESRRCDPAADPSARPDTPSLTHTHRILESSNLYHGYAVTHDMPF